MTHAQPDGRRHHSVQLRTQRPADERFHVRGNLGTRHFSGAIPIRIDACPLACGMLAPFHPDDIMPSIENRAVASVGGLVDAAPVMAENVRHLT
ncbi:hypothetical protein [Burkholderia ubonensis]|uniref:hypothetical protein n=1 Tax=Burkholderia ubonensis TaxID=101571 RepID=UPI000A9085FC|nr:hypothetical protein [Burkholderia ubonensis]